MFVVFPVAVFMSYCIVFILFYCLVFSFVFHTLIYCIVCMALCIFVSDLVSSSSPQRVKPFPWERL